MDKILETDIEKYNYLRDTNHLKDDVAYIIKDYPTIDKIHIGGQDFKISGSSMMHDGIIDRGVNLLDEINKLKKAMSAKVTMVHNCQNCGAALDIEENRPVFHCKYCGAVYLIGTERLMQAY